MNRIHLSAFALMLTGDEVWSFELGGVHFGLRYHSKGATPVWMVNI